MRLHSEDIRDERTRFYVPVKRVLRSELAENPLQLIGNRFILNNWAGNQLRKERNIQSDICQIPLYHGATFLAAVYINDITHRLKGKK